ncbi:hypothetical protein [Kitasatospora sp. DSM 101779]|uniref:hypothetical protein n=1 Tax=Kitasatospora sp. DSM 101779 TaxID=2853165 RepID=UPI0021DB0F6F|nr:hypothetical protein [Kitasatospora sp. DSM 101779]MCU7820759.1 hypothetical protein [Kitasatospora sp. DSM 101779]
MRVRTTALVCTAVLAAATACADPGPGASSAGPGAAPASGPTWAVGDAAAVTKRLLATGLPVKLTATYSGADDPDGLLGRPRQYTSKAAFDDTRVSNSPLAKEEAAGHRRDAVSYGGAVEVFAAPEDAEARAGDLAGRPQSTGGGARPDYVYRSGVVVVRVSHLLTPEQAQAYARAVG